MRKHVVTLFVLGTILSIGSIVVVGQAATASTIEIVSPVKEVDGVVTFDSDRSRTCFNLVTLKHGCSGPSLFYGNRFGENWDIFAVNGGESDQTRGVDLGKLAWDDQSIVPEIQPWPKLEPGQRRHISINTSGADGAHGKPGRNADGTYAQKDERPPVREGFGDKPVDKQVQTTVNTTDGTTPSEYSPYIQITKGHIYAFRVVDASNDYYLLIRIDDLIRGVKTNISYKKITR